MVDSLKEIVTIIIGLSITIAATQFLAPNGAVKQLQDITLQSFLTFALLVINTVRFYHGNMRHLDTTYIFVPSGESRSGVKHHPIGEKAALDYFVVILESLILVAISFYQANLLSFFSLFIGLMIIDAIWFLVAYQAASDRKTLNHQKVWIINNIGAIIVTLLTFAFFDHNEIADLWIILLFIMFANAGIDYGVNWRFYFPVPSKKGRRE